MYNPEKSTKMKKHILLFFVGILCSIGAIAQVTWTPVPTKQMNPFAYNLGATLSDDQSTLTITYCLNADVTSLNVVIKKEGQEYTYPITENSKLTKTKAIDSSKPYDPYLNSNTASHVVNIPTAGLLTELGMGTFEWRIEVRGEGRSNCGVYSLDGTNPYKHKFYRPSSVDIVQDPTSFNYGKVLVVESQHTVSSKTGYHSSKMVKTKGTAAGNTDPQGAGVYVFNPDLTPRENTSGTYVFNGKSDSRFANTSFSPHRVRVSEDGRMFVTSMDHTKGAILWEIDNYFSTWTTVIGKGVGGAKYNTSTYDLTTSGGSFIAGPNAGFDVRGTGSELTLLMLSCDKTAFAADHKGFECREYKLGKAPTWSTVPSKDFDTNEHVFVTERTSNVQYDKDGGIWCVSYRAECNNDQPGLVHKTAAGVEDCRILRSNTKNAALRFNKTFTRAMMASENNYGALYDYIPDHGSNNASQGYFFNQRNIDMSAVGTYLNDFAWDNANNIYAVGQVDAQNGGNGHLVVYCLPYTNADVFSTPAPQPFTISNTVIWHPYHCGEVNNEDLWELFMEDWNEWYMNSSTQRITEKKANQPITGALGFTLPADENADGTKKYSGGLAKDFMTNPNSPWKWLGDYILPIANPHTIPADNAALWTAFKPYYNTYYGLSRADQPIEMVSTFIAAKAHDIMTKDNSQYKWLGDYVISIAGNPTSGNEEKWWRANLHAFFNRTTHSITATTTPKVTSADFSVAGQPSAWQPYYQDADGNVPLSTDLEWRKQIHAFFNHTNEVGYNKAGVGWVTEKTGDFTSKGLPKPNGDPAAGWHNAWWSATFHADVQNGDPMPKVKRKGYAFAGWCYGTAEGYYMSQRVGASGYDNKQPYSSHLWARWIELCLDEGYKPVDDCALSLSLEEKGMSDINHNMELIQMVGGGSATLDVKRKFSLDSYNTFVLPFAIPKNKATSIKKVTNEDGKLIFDPDNGGVKPSILVYDGVSALTVGGEDILQFNFHELDDDEVLLANRPFLIKPAPTTTLTPRLHFWTAYVSGATFADVTPGDDVTFIPAIAPQEIQLPYDVENPDDEIVALILVAQNRLAKTTQGGDMLGLRGYFLVPASLAQRPAQIAIRKDTPAGEEQVQIYPVTTARKVVRDGRVYIIHEGRMYDMMGTLVE